MALFIMDVCDVTFKRKSDGHVVFTSEAQTSSISQTVDEEQIKGGIGSRTIYTIKSNKELELTVVNATFDLEWLAITQGVKVQKDANAVVQGKAEAVVADGMVDLPESALVDNDIYVLNSLRESMPATVEEGKVIIPADLAKDGDNVQVIYEKEVTGNKVELRADTFAEKYEVQYMTYIYESTTEARQGTLYIKFHEATPSSAFEMSLANGTAYTPELSFIASANAEGSIGEYFTTDEK